MNKSTIAGILAAATVIIGTAGAALAPAASAATPTASGVRTAIQSAEVSTSVQILTTKPNSITVIGHGGQPVTVWTKGTQPITKKPVSASPVTFTGLKAGQSYAVYVGATQASVVRTLTAAGVASAVTVQAGPIESSIDVSWSIALPAGTKASSVSYVIEATSPTASPVTMKVIGTDHALITGLSPDAKYSFTVTPMLGAVKGTPASATMIVTVAEAFALAKDEAGGNADQVAKPAAPVAPVAPVAPAAPSAPAAPAAPAGPAAPSTRTIYVCAAGFTEAAGLCQKTAAYTFHTETTTSPYTYHQEFVKTGSHVEYSTSGNGTYYPQNAWNPQDGSPAGFYSVVDDGYYASAKDAPPTGFTDSGSEYTKSTQVKDAAPAGYADNGTQWVLTAPMEAKVVPA